MCSNYQTNKMKTLKFCDVKINEQNSISILNFILSKEGLPPAVFNYDIISNKNQQKFRSSIQITLPSNGKTYFFQTINTSKKAGSTKCALNILHQMANDGKYIKNESTFNKNDKRNFPSKSTIKVYDDPELFRDLKAFYNFLNIKFPDFENNPNEPIIISAPSISKLNRNIKNELCPYEKNYKSNIANLWFPPQANYNCWLGCFMSNDDKWWNKNISEISKELFQIESKKNTNLKMEEDRQKLHIFEKRSQIIEASECHQVLLIKSNTGSGKSTQVPQILLNRYILTDRGGEFNCIITQPRRLSAINLAKRVAKERGEYLGNSVGYYVRFDKVEPRPFGSIVFGTIGAILKKFSHGFKGISHIIVDEVHERSLETDFLLIILKMIIQKYKELRIILMSATIDTKQFEEYFEDIKVIEFTVKSYEVEEIYLDEFIQQYNYIPSDVDIPFYFDMNRNMWSFNNILSGTNTSLIAKYIAKQIEMNKKFPYDIIIKMIKECARNIFNNKNDGSILVFVPGWVEISTCIRMLEDVKESYMYWVLPLHSNLSDEEQNYVFHPPPNGKIKIVISTNIAESSITINDILYVIDSCKRKVQTQCLNITTLTSNIEWASRYSTEQRKGRAGRTRRGHCYRLITKECWNSLSEQNEPEIKTFPLQSIILDIKSLGLGDSKKFLSYGMEKIDDKNIFDSEDYLMQLSALDKNCNLTYIGKVIQSLPFTPDVGKCIITALLFDVVDSISIISGICGSSRTLFKHDCKPEELLDFISYFCGDYPSDHLLPLLILKKNILSEEGNNNISNVHKYVKTKSLQYIEKVKNQLLNILMKQFKNYSFVDYRLIESKISCPPIHVIISLLVNSLYPNIAYQIGKKNYVDMDQTTLNIDRYSTLSLNIDNHNKKSPFILYGQKILDKNIVIKECTSISPLQILLFGSSKAIYNGERHVILDDCYLFIINPKFAQMVLHLKIIINNLLYSYCANKKLNDKEKAVKYFIRNLIERITTMAHSVDDKYFEKVKLENPTKVNFKGIGGATS
uniref:RNA helicase n=1 Tax=Strongyloides stercoralis TaxID=6248 RepID=A0AAF5HYW9_STRER